VEVSGARLDRPYEGGTLADALLAPTRIYVKPLLALMAERAVHAAAHITGGGLPGNVPRVLPAGTRAVIDARAWQWPAIFRWLQEGGAVEDAEMYRTFNCGIGMVLALAPGDAAAAIAALAAHGARATVIGRIEAHGGEPEVVIEK
jgi:phosphoribosylformylglycinamidine cyclo-ligase